RICSQLLRPSRSSRCPYTTLFRSRSRLAAEALGDAHGLDGGRPVATVVLAAWCHHDAQTFAATTDSPVRARDLWAQAGVLVNELDRKSTRLNSSHVKISYAVFCLK